VVFFEEPQLDLPMMVVVVEVVEVVVQVVYALLASAAKTGRVVIVQEAPRTCGFAAELAAVLAEKAILDLRGPVLRVTGYDVPYPYWQIEDAYMPSAERVVAAARRLLEF
jgi:pyruvate/2-oxoglutarate/acetoin dehydrogenase E1 component